MLYVFFFFFNYTATTEIYTYRHTLSLHDALPISAGRSAPEARTGRRHSTAYARHCGARGGDDGTRTRKPFRANDFKSFASASFATSPRTARSNAYQLSLRRVHRLQCNRGRLDDQRRWGHAATP